MYGGFSAYPQAGERLRIRGMFNIPLDEADQQNEPEQIRSLSKKQLHKCIGIRKALPDLDARCCTRAYLVRVHLDEVYSVSRDEQLTFEASLQPDESLSSPFFNVGQVTTRLDQLLTHEGKLNFGFPAGRPALWPRTPGSAGCSSWRTQPTCCKAPARLGLPSERTT